MMDGDNGTDYTDYENEHGGVDDRPRYQPSEEPPETYNGSFPVGRDH
jgi:hypothetical protein